jgi:ABC-type sugar transport system permease subunit
VQYGYAAAIGVVLFVIIFSATLIQRRIFEGREPTTA